MAYSDKPKLGLAANMNASWHNDPNGIWVCHNDYYIVGKGKTPMEAYNHWAQKMDTLAYIPRRGIWNIRDVSNWWSRGCPPYRSYLGTQRFIGYIPQTDELVLQG